ncbi:hypothetical protein EBI01_09230 [Marinomonas rhizomae]|uniref:Autoinducer binding domain-containing protein n=1 Tax=Marinomonas rhizomae TaxID=491948 RepID=A0A366JCB5_9GAMM|nr:autoinducer binding domain-containing protein [Marinomonas rhizomae]RBP83944.1 autoinducer binding domain-containing protein [Marinomonas rhizomae]RNF73357.1 hypothetical protein EBI01_09230 [Marinomonas rhizomae]
MDVSKTSFASCFSDSFENLTDEIEKIGFDAVLYSFYPRPMYLNSAVQPVLHFSEGFSSFVQYYIKNDYGNRDFVLRLASQGRRTPIDWWEEISLGNVTREEKNVTVDAKEKFGISNGLSVPIFYGKFAIAGISVITKKTESQYFKDLKVSSMVDLERLSRSYHYKVMESKEDLRFFIAPLLETFTAKKIMVLKHLLNGEALTEIEHHYPISRRYAEKLLLNIREEFGGISTNELMYMLGTINIDEYL